MQVNLLTFLVQSLATPGTGDIATLRAIQQASTGHFRPQRCPKCHVRLFDGWLFGELKCWNCNYLFIGYIEKFVEALNAITMPPIGGMDGEKHGTYLTKLS